LKSRLAWLEEDGHADLIRRGLRGVEKECLRIDRHGQLSRSPHPPALGAALTHPHITTDYSEALLEFVTPPCATNWETLQFLCDLHCFVTRNIDDERLWAQSMPCAVGPEEDVPIAYYGQSNLGQMKTIYRRGLGHRYGRAMQAIAGVHFNYSLPVGFWAAYRDGEGSQQSESAFVSEQYLHIARNYRRNAWVLIYLFGASPAVCKSFPLRDGHGLEELDPNTWYLPYGTSLRMSDVGYRNKNQARLQISLNSLAEYVGGLTTAVTTSSPDFERIGVNVDGEYRQLNANILQIENEYYAAVRPKPKTQFGPRPTIALRRSGVEYLEMRTLDLNVADPVGVNQTQLRFIEALVLYCLFSDSPPMSAAEQAQIDARELLVAVEGRRPSLELPFGGTGVPLSRLGLDLLEDIAPFAAVLDDAEEGYMDALELQRTALTEPEATPSARLLADMTARGQGYLDYMLDVSDAHAAYFRSLTPAENRAKQLEELARKSIEDAHALDVSTQEPLEDYLAAYFAEV